MTSFGRTTEQDVIWVELNTIRAFGDKGLLSPEDGGYGDDELAEEWDELVVEYNEIHTENGTKG